MRVILELSSTLFLLIYVCLIESYLVVGAVDKWTNQEHMNFIPIYGDTTAIVPYI
jgi:hypothetical protein